MLDIKRILCPTDLSRESDEALRYAVALALAYNSKLYLLNCTKIRTPNHRLEERSCSVATASAFEEALSAHLGLRSLSEIEWEPLALENVSDVGEAISHQAGVLDVDLIVMRSRRRPHAAVLLGSTAETVSRLAPCPLLVTHPQEREWVGFSTSEIDLNRVLVAYDFTPAAKLALTYGMSLAQQFQTELHLLHVLPQTLYQDPKLASRNSSQELALSRLERVVPRDVSLWCRVTNAIRRGKPHEEAVAYAKENKIDLICVGANSDELSLGTILGSKVDRILRQAPCPVLVAGNVKPAKQIKSEFAEFADVIRSNK